ncbi:hypothetical protein LUZ60_012289 [Juncus effusus]|nr:hypothetical protein LUZ60_012289 [Juncus effusus]
MAASIATSAFFPSSSYAKPSLSRNSINGGSKNSKAAKFTSKPVNSSQSVRNKSPIKAVPKLTESVPVPTNCISTNSNSSPCTFYYQLPDWSMLLAAITTVFLAAEKQWTLLDNWKPKWGDILADVFQLGRIMQDGLVFRQNFLIRSYEIVSDKTASIQTIMNLLQETALNHMICAGLMGDGFGTTPEMSKRNLIWVVCKMQVFFDSYPSWGDIVEIDTWMGPHSKNRNRRDWHIKDYNTGKTILRATSLWVMMNKQTRKLAKIPEEVRNEIEPHFVEGMPILDEYDSKFPKLEGLDGYNAEKHLLRGLTPMWEDLDANQHVNNVKYIGWILESASMEMLEKHELAEMTLEYRRECNKDSVVQSLTTVYTDGPQDSEFIHCDHKLSLESGPTIVMAHTTWRPKADHVERKEVVNLNEAASVGV